MVKNGVVVLESTRFLTDLIGKDKINCNVKSKDRYNRYIGVCYKNDVDLNSEMVINGWAIAYRYYSLITLKKKRLLNQKRLVFGLESLKNPTYTGKNK